MHCYIQCLWPCSRLPPTPLLKTPGHSHASPRQSLVGSLLLSPGSWCAQDFVCALQESISPVLCKFWWLYGGVNGDRLLEGLCHGSTASKAPVPAAGDCWPVPLQKTPTQVWLSLCETSGSWCTQNFVWCLRASLVGMGFDSKCDFSLPTILPLLFPWMWGKFFGRIQHSPFNGCSAVSCNFGGLSGEDEYMSFYSIILESNKFTFYWTSTLEMS